MVESFSTLAASVVMLAPLLDFFNIFWFAAAAVYEIATRTDYILGLTTEVRTDTTTHRTVGVGRIDAHVHGRSFPRLAAAMKSSLVIQLQKLSSDSKVMATVGLGK